MLDILLFAYIVRCLLEYRIDGRESQLFRAAVIYGAAMSNNWLMGGFLPVFVAGRINQPQEAEAILASGHADVCGMTRAMICDPDMPDKARRVAAAIHIRAGIGGIGAGDQMDGVPLADRCGSAVGLRVLRGQFFPVFQRVPACPS